MKPTEAEYNARVATIVPSEMSAEELFSANGEYISKPYADTLIREAYREGFGEAASKYGHFEDRCAEFERALRIIYSTVYSPEGMSETATLDSVLNTAGEALGLTE